MWVIRVAAYAEHGSKDLKADAAASTPCADRAHRTNPSIVAKIEDPVNAQKGPHVADHIEFFYEFASPYSFIAAQRLPALAEKVGRTIRWRPIELQKVWAAQGILEAYGVIRKAKRSYILTDVKRTADDLGIVLKPPGAPIDATLARLAVYGLEASIPGLCEIDTQTLAETLGRGAQYIDNE